MEEKGNKEWKGERGGRGRIRVADKSPDNSLHHETGRDVGK